MKTIKIDECIRRIRSYAMQLEAEGQKSFSEDLWVAVDFLNQQETKCFDCTRREWYMKGYQDGLNADKWIPCEVDMPKEEYGTYWIAAEMEGYPCFYYCSAVYTSEHGFRTHDIEAQGKVVAWQPIQLYKKEGAE